jgi:hypothetical protein
MATLPWHKKESGLTEQDTYNIRTHSRNYAIMCNEQELRDELVNSFVEIARLKKIIDNFSEELEKCQKDK